MSVLCWGCCCTAFAPVFRRFCCKRFVVRDQNNLPQIFTSCVFDTGTAHVFIAFIGQDVGDEGEGEEGHEENGAEAEGTGEEGDDADNEDEEEKQKEGFETLAPEEKGEEEGQDLLQDEQQPKVTTPFHKVRFVSIRITMFFQE